MSDVLSATPGVPGPEAVPGKVFRSELNPVDFLRRAAYMYPERVAVVDGERRYSYRDLAERSWQLANALRSAGLGKGDRVATLLFNSSAMLEAHFGVPAAGGILVAVNHRLASAEIGYILQHSGARYLLLDTGLEALAALVRQTPGIAAWNGPYLRGGAVPNDPWNHGYIYRSPGEHGPYDIVSFGSDGQEGGSGNAAVSRWAKAPVDLSRLTPYGWGRDCIHRQFPARAGHGTCRHKDGPGRAGRQGRP